MRCYSRYNSAEEKRKRSEKASRAAQARWDAYHALLAESGEPIITDPPADMYRITFENLMTGKAEILTFHPGPRLNNYRIEVNGKPWRVCGFVDAMDRLVKSCYRLARI
jgi:hypothetical protein